MATPAVIPQQNQQGYLRPPLAPEGGWRGAQRTSNIEYWTEQMMMRGYDLDTIMGIYNRDSGGDTYPNHLKNSFLAKNWLFPGADMMYEYDLDNQRRRHYTYTSQDQSEPKGPFEWEPMSPSEQAVARQYYDWRNDPRNEWMITGMGTGGSPENPYAAWLSNWGDRFKNPNWTPGTDGPRLPATDNKSGPPAPTNLAPPAGTTSIPGGGGGGGNPDEDNKNEPQSPTSFTTPGPTSRLTGLGGDESIPNQIPGLAGPSTTTQSIPGLQRRRRGGIY